MGRIRKPCRLGLFTPSSHLWSSFYSAKSIPCISVWTKYSRELGDVRLEGDLVETQHMHSDLVSDLYQGGTGQTTQLGVSMDGRRICRVYAVFTVVRAFAPVFGRSSGFACPLRRCSEAWESRSPIRCQSRRYLIFQRVDQEPLCVSSHVVIFGIAPRHRQLLFRD